MQCLNYTVSGENNCCEIHHETCKYISTTLNKIEIQHLGMISPRFWKCHYNRWNTSKVINVTILITVNCNFQHDLPITSLNHGLKPGFPKSVNPNNLAVFPSSKPRFVAT